MNKEELLKSLRDLQNFLPRIEVDEDFKARMAKVYHIDQLVEQYNKKLQDLNSGLVDFDEDSAIELSLRELELARKERFLNVDEANLKNLYFNAETFDTDISVLEDNLTNVSEMNENLTSTNEILERRLGIATTDEDRKRIKTLLNQNRSAIEQNTSQMRIIETKIERLKTSSESRSKLIDDTKKSLISRSQETQKLKKALEDFRSGLKDADKLGTYNAKLELESKINSLTQLSSYLSADSPTSQLQSIINDYRNDEVTEDEVQERLSNMKFILSLGSADSKNRNEELSVIAKQKEELESEIAKFENALSDGTVFGATKQNEIAEYDRKRNLFTKEIGRLDYEISQANRQKNTNNYNIEQNEILMEDLSRQISEFNINRSQRFIEGSNMSEERKLETYTQMSANYQSLKDELALFEEENNSLKLDNVLLDEQIAQNQNNKENHSKLLFSLVSKAKFNTSERRLEKLDVDSKKNELSALNLREEYLKTSLEDRVDNILSKFSGKKTNYIKSLTSEQKKLVDSLLSKLTPEEEKAVNGKLDLLLDPNTPTLNLGGAEGGPEDSSKDGLVGNSNNPEELQKPGESSNSTKEQPIKKQREMNKKQRNQSKRFFTRRSCRVIAAISALILLFTAGLYGAKKGWFKSSSKEPTAVSQILPRVVATWQWAPEKLESGRSYYYGIRTILGTTGKDIGIKSINWEVSPELGKIAVTQEGSKNMIFSAILPETPESETITSTNGVITATIVDEFGVKHVLKTNITVTPKLIIEETRGGGAGETSTDEPEEKIEEEIPGGNEGDGGNGDPQDPEEPEPTEKNSYILDQKQSPEKGADGEMIVDDSNPNVIVRDDGQYKYYTYTRPDGTQFTLQVKYDPVNVEQIDDDTRKVTDPDMSAIEIPDVLKEKLPTTGDEKTREEAGQDPSVTAEELANADAAADAWLNNYNTLNDGESDIQLVNGR